MRTKAEELKYINQLQDQYVDELICHIESKENEVFKETNLTSPTGTGKTEMIAKLINKKPDWYFIITTLSHGQLNKQVESAVKQRCTGDNYKIYGVSSFTKASILSNKDILADLPSDKKVIWLRDEGHRNTNNWSELLEEICFKIVNISATNKSDNGVVCNFTDTMMLRTVKQQEGDINDALQKFIEVKKAHDKVKNYTPCILFRVVSAETAKQIMSLCIEKHIRCISLVGYDDYDMSDLCKDNCDIEAIIYMQKMDVGIDIRRAHVIWIQTKPKNATTTIQCVGRCRRNALFWRDDIDILAPKNRALLEKTRICYAFYKIEGTRIDTNEFGELVNAFCPYISIQKLRPNSKIVVDNGMMQNGLMIIELNGCSGEYTITTDKSTGLNIVNNKEFYRTQRARVDNHLLDPRMEQLFIPSRKICRAITQIIEQIDKHPYLYTSFGFYILDHLPNEKIQLGFIKREIYFALKEVNGKCIIEECAREGKRINSISSFMNDITANHLFHHDHVYFVHGRDPSQAIRTIKASDFTALNDIFKLARICLHLSKAKTDDFPIIISKDKFWKESAKFPYSRVLRLSKNTPIEPSTIILHYNGYTYTYGECLKIAHHGSIAPGKAQHYNVVTNNKELSIIGPELYHNIENNWYPNRSITSLLDSNTKLRKFLFHKFGNVIEQVSPYFYRGKNNFEFDDRRQNSCLGYCVEYYAKSLVYNNYLKTEMQNIYSFKHGENASLIRACLEKYRKMMIATFGEGMKKLLKFPTTETLGSAGYQAFIDTCFKLGVQTKNRIQKWLGLTQKIDMEYDTVLSTRHLCGLMDIVSHDTIIDIKVTSTISETMVLQVLAYYYLSTFRSDLAIDRVIIYDASCDRYLIICGLKTGNVEIIANYEPKQNGYETEVKEVVDMITSERIAKQDVPKNKLPNNTKNSVPTKVTYVGLSSKMNCGKFATVIEDFGCNDITVQFEDGVIKEHCRRDKFREGKIGYPK